MKVNNFLKNLISIPKELEFDTSLLSRFNKCKIPKDTGLSLRFPDRIYSRERKILYALWKEGIQPYANLLLLTGLSKDELNGTLKNLRDKNLIEMGFLTLKRVDNSSDNHAFFSLTNNN